MSVETSPFAPSRTPSFAPESYPEFLAVSAEEQDSRTATGLRATERRAPLQVRRLWGARPRHDLLVGVWDRGDAGDPGAHHRHRRVHAGDTHHRRHSCRVGAGAAVIPASHCGISTRRRIVRGCARELRTQSCANRCRCTADRLHRHGGGPDISGDRRAHLGVCTVDPIQLSRSPWR